MYSFNNDYSEGAHPRILEAMAANNMKQAPGYGLDAHTEHARVLIRQAIGRDDTDIHLIAGGTQTNLITISTALRPWQAVICADTGHINVHETGAIEATGHKVLGIPTTDGKLNISGIQQVLDCHTDEHMVQPKMVYISDSTELGTCYTRAELAAISGFCRQKELFLFLDGARLGSALVSTGNDLSLPDIARLTDVFYIGGTKNGALFGEALVICHPSLKPDFRFMIKQRGAMMAKGWLLGIQFEELFQNGLFFNMAGHAGEMAGLLRQGIAGCGFSFRWNSETNQLFPIFPNELIAKLEKDFIFSPQQIIDEKHTCIRLVTSWATKLEAVHAFVTALQHASGVTG